MVGCSVLAYGLGEAAVLFVVNDCYLVSLGAQVLLTDLCSLRDWGSLRFSCVSQLTPS